MAKRDLPSQELLRQLLRYDRETGKLFWLPRSLEWFANDRSYRSWNSRCADKEAFTALTDTGYRHGDLNGIKYYAHRIIWKMTTGEDPEQVDHINGNRADNRFLNLRAVSHLENGQNAKRRRDNTSGYMGVSWFSRRKCWRARICVGGREHHLGYFETRDEALSARKSAEKEFGFHQNHNVERHHPSSPSI